VAAEAFGAAVLDAFGRYSRLRVEKLVDYRRRTSARSSSGCCEISETVRFSGQLRCMVGGTVTGAR
jgi:hypothetical protein